MIRIVAALLLASAPAFAWDAIRCNEKLVHVGSSKYAVESWCGQPTAVDRWTEDRQTGDPDTHEFVEVEEWTYDRGPTHFVQILRFEKGRLCNVRDGDYGH